MGIAAGKGGPAALTVFFVEFNGCANGHTGGFMKKIILNDLALARIGGKISVYGFDTLGQMADMCEGIAGGWSLVSDEDLRALLRALLKAGGCDPAVCRAVAKCEVSFELPDGRLYEWVWVED